ncbi:hypothetical protein ILUMI_21944 [Ignelater luminosus]|uniref:Uncharacterized protein n=1 Tax=Ignelater luminosus TaxID=2038154 RepID=A0A8K0CBH9_IGNLU|nr:hypothetical protein ILUMI_21944 [Ignelater luminosus]
MPNTYIRKLNAKPRGLWTLNDLQSAINVVRSGMMGVNEAIAQNRTPEKSSSVPDIRLGNALDLVSPVPVITLAAKSTRRQIADVLSLD